MKNVKHENRQKLILFEGFRQNGLQIRIQRIFLRISTPVKIDFDIFSKMIFSNMKMVKKLYEIESHKALNHVLIG